MDSKDFIVRLKHHIYNGNVSSVTQHSKMTVIRLVIHIRLIRRIKMMIIIIIIISTKIGKVNK